MSYNQSLIAELTMESANTRKLLELVPMDQSDWQPHEKSMKLGSLANHIAELSAWITFIVSTDELDLATITREPLPATNEALITKFDDNLSKAVASLEKATTEDFAKMWTLRRGAHVILSMPKITVIRSLALNHVFHHRGQLSVYLRLLHVPIPGMYGPSADDMIAMAAQQAAAAN